VVQALPGAIGKGIIFFRPRLLRLPAHLGGRKGRCKLQSLEVFYTHTMPERWDG